MSKLVNTLLIVFLFYIELYSQTLSNIDAKNFITDLINENPKLTQYVLPDELNISNRLGINYKNIPFKFLISNDIDPTIKGELKSGILQYSFHIEDLKNDYSKLTIEVPVKNYKISYYFKDNYLISPEYYFAADWKTIKSKYFIFHLKDSSLTNLYSIKRLDQFVDKMAKLLNISNSRLKLLEIKKIHYYLCKNENEVDELTGFNTAGMYYIPYDYLITSYNCHLHELLHLLINFKLQNLPLYTLSFLQEGFAVAFGGRWGKEPGVLWDMAVYLQKSGMIDYTDLLSKQEFLNYDASISYPISGLYTKFLFARLGVENYIRLYKKYSGNDLFIDTIKIKNSDLPLSKDWKSFVDSSMNCPKIIPISEPAPNNYELIKYDSSFKIFEDKTSYLFEIKDTLLISVISKYPGYESNIYRKLFPGRKYKSEKYLIEADSNEISIYNLFTNNLIGKYVSSFAIPVKLVSKVNGFYEFIVSKSVFDEPLNKLWIKNF